MNVFLVPSWYPHPADPSEGVFNQDQALAIGALRPDWNVAVSLWGQGETLFRVRHPGGWARALSRVRDARTVRIAPNVVEYRRPVLTWSGRIAGGRRGAVLEASRRNLERAQRDLGGIDVIHAYVSYPGGWAAMHLSKEMGIPYVISEPMGGPFPFPSFLEADGSLKSILAKPLRAAGARLAVSPTQAGRMRELGIDDVDVVPLLADETFFTPPTREPPPPFTFLCVARLIEAKGIDDLLQAAAALARSGSDIRFHIAGGGDVERWRARARDLGVEGRVDFLGLLSRERLRDAYRDAHAFVLPSHHEAGSTATVEALACGRPIVATRCGAPEFIVTPEVGTLVEIRSPEQLAQACLTHAASDRYDPTAIRRRFLDTFSRPAVVDGIERAYRKALG